MVHARARRNTRIIEVGTNRGTGHSGHGDSAEEGIALILTVPAASPTTSSWGRAAEDWIGCALPPLNVKFSWPSAPTLRGFLTVITLAEWLILTSPRARGMDLRCVTLIFDHGY